MKELYDLISGSPDHLDFNKIYTLWQQHKLTYPTISSAFDAFERFILNELSEYDPIKKVVFLGNYINILNDALTNKTNML